MSDADPTDPTAEEADEAVRAAERHLLAEENADHDEEVVVRDPESGATSGQRAQ